MLGPATLADVPPSPGLSLVQTPAPVSPARVVPRLEKPPYSVREGGSLLCFVRDPDGYRIELIDRSGR